MMEAHSLIYETVYAAVYAALGDAPAAAAAAEKATSAYLAAMTMDTDTINNLADEFAENGLTGAADCLRRHGPDAARRYIDNCLAAAGWTDEGYVDSEGWILGNLQVARERLGD